MNPLRKGRKGEQEVARHLYKAHFGEDPPADRQVFIRVGLGRKQPKGDLIVPSDFPFIVEVKNTEVPFHRLPAFLSQWMQPYQGDLHRLMVVFKNNRKWWVSVSGLYVKEVANTPIFRGKVYVGEWEVGVWLMPLEVFCSLWRQHMEVMKNEGVSQNPELAQVGRGDSPCQQGVCN